MGLTDESRLVDTANQFHLWVFMDPAFRMSVGFHERLVADGPYTDGTKQHPFEPASRPADCLTGPEIEALQKAQGER